MACGELALGISGAEGGINAHDLTGRLHLGAEDRIDSREPYEREDRFFNCDKITVFFFCEAQFLQGFAKHYLCGEFRKRHADRLRDERHCAARPRIDLQYIYDIVLHGILDIHEPFYF